jgi:carboxynorspermidine decarboxylase
MHKLKAGISNTPAFALDLDQVNANLQPLQYLRQATDCKVLYSMKALPLSGLLKALVGQVDGISVSSLNEARLAREMFADPASLHLTTPGLRPHEFKQIDGLCSHISFNSLSQYQRFKDQTLNASKGLRINPKLSFADDERYDPCRKYSKLGVNIHELSAGLPTDVEGLHLHTVFSQTDFKPLQLTLQSLQPWLSQQTHLKWLNLGGGYLLHSIADLTPLKTLIQQLHQQGIPDIYLEPGKALVGNAGYLLTTVLDRFVSDGKTLLILDTSVNHHPEVFEYRRKPVLLEEDPQGSQSAILAGSTCLAGDLFGEYRFKELPKVGEKLMFADVGAYSLIKASRFNGYALPAIYCWQAGEVHLVKDDKYAHYRLQWCVT